MKIVVASALGGETLRRCLDSMLATLPASVVFDLHVMRERGSREDTLNVALDQVGTDDDWLVVGDDIEFTPGWYEALMAQREQAEILGLCTLYPGSDRVQDRGYDLIQVDGQITVEAFDRGLEKQAAPSFGVRRCDAVCGCLMFIDQSVFQRVAHFSEEGRNRWGEFIFAQQARRAGARIAVVDHYVFHAGSGTKSNPKPELRSTSYLVERDHWRGIVERHVDPGWVRVGRLRVLSPALHSDLRSTARILIYGVGTVTEFLLDSAAVDPEGVAFCSGLTEETGREFRGQRIQAVNEVDFDRYDWVLVTPLNRGAQIVRETLLPKLPEGYPARISWVERTTGGSEERYSVCDVEASRAISRSGAVSMRMP